jgi:hypothetical protein
MAISVYFRKLREDDAVVQYEFGETPASCRIRRCTRPDRRTAPTIDAATRALRALERHPAA